MSESVECKDICFVKCSSMNFGGCVGCSIREIRYLGVLRGIGSVFSYRCSRCYLCCWKKRW